MACNSSATINIKTIANLAAIKLAIDGFKEIVSLTAAFQEQMSRVQAVSQAGADELAKLSERARELGRETIFTATEAGKGMEELARLGFTVKENYQAIEAVLNLAASSSLELGRASEIVAGSLRSFGESADQASRFTDILATTAAKSGTTVDFIGESLKHAGAIANTAGVSFEEFNAVLGVFGDRLIRGEQAGTGFRQLIVGISTQAPKGAKALKELGLTYEDIDVSTKGLIPVLQLLKDRFDQVEGAQRRLQLAADIWGRRQFNAALVALDSVDKIDKLAKAYERGTGAAKRMADVMVDNLAGDFKLFRSAIQEVALKIGDSMSPALRQVTQNFTEMARESAKTGTALENIGKSLATIVLGFDLLIKGLQFIHNGLKVVFGEIFIAVEEFELKWTRTLQSIAASTGFQERADELGRHARDIEAALKKNIKVLEDAREKLGNSALGMEDSWGKLNETWEDGSNKLSRVDTKPIFDGVQKISNALKQALRGAQKEVTVESKQLAKALQIFNNVDLSRLNEESRVSVSRYISTLTQTIKKELDKGTKEVKVSTDTLSNILRFSRLIQGVDPRVKDSIEVLIKSIKKSLDDGAKNVQLSVDELTEILRFGKILKGIDVDKLSKEGKQQIDAFIDQLIVLLQKAGQDIDPQILAFSRRLQGLGDGVKAGGQSIGENIPGLEGSLDRVVHSIETSIGRIDVESKKLQSTLSNILGFDKEKILEDAAALEATLSEIKISGIQLDPEQQERLNKQVEEVVEGLRKIKEAVPPLTKELGASLGLWVSGFGEMSAAAQDAAGSVEESTKKMSGSVEVSAERFEESGATFNVYAERAADAMQRSTRVVEEYDEKTGKVTKSIVAYNREAEESAKDLGEGYEDLGSKSKESGEKQEDAASKVDKSADVFNKTASAGEKMAKQLREAQEAAGMLAKSGGELKQSLDESRGSVDSISEAASKLKEKLESLGEKVGIDIDKKPLEDYVEFIKNAKSEIDSLKSNTGDVGTKLNEIGSQTLEVKVDQKQLLATIDLMNQILEKGRQIDQLASN